MATFGKFIHKSELQTTEDARPIYSEPIGPSAYTPTAADLLVQEAVGRCDAAYLMWIDAWNGRAPVEVCEKLWIDYQSAYNATRTVLCEQWGYTADGIN